MKKYVLVLGALALAAFILREPLIAWFRGAPAEHPQPSAASPQYAPAVLDALRSGLDAYERVRSALARDQLDAVPEAARVLAEALAASDQPAPAATARELAAARDLAAARKLFAKLNSELLPLLARDARLTRGVTVFECPMFDHARWLQPSTATDNPYMGLKMRSCGSATSWPQGDAAAIDHYTCSMHPSVHQAGPGKCPICGMDLVPVTVQQQREDVVIIDEARRQLIGVRTAEVIKGPMRKTISAVGRVAYDESGLTDVNLKLSGWITKLYVNQTGQRVTRGQTLFTLYSPDLYAAAQDLLLAAGHEPLVRAARKRLGLLGLSDAQIDQIAASAEPSDSIPITSPASGFVIEKEVVEGAAVQASTRLFRIAALDKVWVEGDVYEDDLSQIHAGQAAKVTLDYMPGRTYDAKVSYVYPYLDSSARTGRVRIELANKQFELRPGMYAHVELATEPTERLQVPAAAIVYTGPRRLAFVDLGEGRFKPQEVRTGFQANGMYEVLEGLEAGQRVATSGTFLIAAEARISTAAKYWDSEAP
jgi:membrane fusion protein, copper/silver efflux system